MIRKITRSLSARLLAVFLATSFIYAFASRYAVELVLDRDYLREMVGAHVSLHTNYFLNDLGSPPDIERAKAIAERNPMDIKIQGPGIDWASDPNFPPLAELKFVRSDFLLRAQEVAADNPAWTNELTEMGFTRYRDHSFAKIETGDYQVIVASPKIATQAGPNLTTPIIGLVSILVLAACYFAVSWLIRPIEWIKEGAGRLGQGDLDYRIPVTAKDDLGELTVDINHMADDVQGMLEAKQQMLLAISHELRSPLTRTKVALEFLQDAQVKQNILEDVEEMEHLITDLLESERLNTRHSKLQVSSVDVVELINDLVATDFAEEQGRIRINAPSQPVRQEVDVTRIRLLVKNLVENALCYTPADAKAVEVTVKPQAGGLLIEVTDHGLGMSPTQVKRATEPFYRSDPARCRDTGGFGLGLYLCRRIAEAHGGSIDIRSEEGVGTEVSIHLPGQPVVSEAA